MIAVGKSISFSLTLAQESPGPTADHHWFHLSSGFGNGKETGSRYQSCLPLLEAKVLHMDGLGYFWDNIEVTGT